MPKEIDYQKSKNQKVFIYGNVEKPDVLVISTTLNKREGDVLYERSLRKQTFENFLFCLTVGGTIAEGWNGGIQYAVDNSIPVVVITETDVVWNSKYLLEFMLKHLEEKSLVTLESESPALCVIHTKNCLRFDPVISRTEDTDWYERLKKHNIKIIKILDNTTFHRTQNIKSILKNIFWTAPLCNVYLVYSDAMKVKHLTGRAVFYTMKSVTSFFATFVGIFYKFLNRKKRQEFLRNERFRKSL